MDTQILSLASAGMTVQCWNFRTSKEARNREGIGLSNRSAGAWQNRFLGSLVNSYAPMIYTVPCVMFLMRTESSMRAMGGGWALEIETILGPVKLRRAEGECQLGPKKVEISRTRRFDKPSANLQKV